MEVLMWKDPLYQETAFWLHLLRSWLKSEQFWLIPHLPGTVLRSKNKAEIIQPGRGTVARDFLLIFLSEDKADILHDIGSFSYKRVHFY
jgi:hypothetical protein